jgi:hypothetical protein
MALIFTRIALLAGLAILTLGVFPDRLRGGILAIATCIAAAFAFHGAVKSKQATADFKLGPFQIQISH